MSSILATNGCHCHGFCDRTAPLRGRGPRGRRGFCHLRRDDGAKSAGDGRCAHSFVAGRNRLVAARALPLAPITASAMRRAHRTAHRMLWPVLALLVGLGLTLSLVMRAPPPAPTAAAEEPR